MCICTEEEWGVRENWETLPVLSTGGSDALPQVPTGRGRADGELGSGPIGPAGLGEELATIEIVDDFSPNASMSFSWDSDGDGLNDTGMDICGSTPEPVEVSPGQQYNGFPYLLPSTTCSDAVATAGTIIITFNKI